MITNDIRRKTSILLFNGTISISIIEHIDNNNHFDIISSSVLENNYSSLNKFISWSLREEQIVPPLFLYKFT